MGFAFKSSIRLYCNKKKGSVVNGHDNTLLGSAEWGQAKMPIIQASFGSALTKYFPSSCLRVQLLISLNLGAACHLFLWDTGKC